MIDLADQFFHATERAAADRLLGDEAEEALDLIQPGAVGGNEVDVPPGAPREPGFHARMLMGAVVVDDQMDVQLFGYSLIDLAQETEELLVPVPRFALSQNLSAGHVQSGEERRRPVALVIVSHSFHIPKPQRQHGLRTLEGLALALLVGAEHQRVLRRIQVKPHHVAQLLDEERIGRELEALGPMRLKAKELEVAVNAGLGDAALGGRLPYAPVSRAAFGLLLQRPLNQPRNLLVFDRPLTFRQGFFSRTELATQFIELLLLLIQRIYDNNKFNLFKT